MKVGIFKLDDGVLQSAYEATEPSQSMYGGPWADSSYCSHLEVALPLLPEFAKLVEGVVVEDAYKKDAYDAAQLMATDVAALEAKRQRRMFGEKVIDRIAVINDGKSLTVNQVIGFMGNANVKSIDALLRSGSIASAASLIQTLDFSVTELSIWSEDDRTLVLNMISASGYLPA